MKALFTLIIGIFLILSYQNGFAQDSVKVAEDSVKLIDNNFNGKMLFFQPEAGTSGEIKFFGSNATIAGGVTVEAGVPVAGRAVKHRVYGEAHFDTTANSVTVFVNGMPSTATVTFSYKNNGSINTGDALSAIFVNNNRSFTIWRGNANVTSGIWFYWTAEWED
jgi:hypothetical protein